MKVYAAYYDNLIRMESSSGGIFSLLATKFDVVYGVAMTPDCYGSEFVRVENDISKIRGSKYFQAKMGDTFQQVKKDLLDGRRVLFSGTGCQINGLSLFLGKQYDNLFLLDILCHGTPSQKLWMEYVKHQETKYGKLEYVNFRCKESCWEDYGIKENQVYISRRDDPFMKLFLWDFCLRPSCYECHAKFLKKADMTIADFWGIENVAPQMNDGKGTSLVITRTEKGQQLFDDVRNLLTYLEVSYEEGVRNNPVEYRSVEKPKCRNQFYIDLNKLGFEKTVSKYYRYMKEPLKIRVKDFFKSKIKYMFKMRG